MFTRRKLPVSILVVVMLTLAMAMSAQAQVALPEVDLGGTVTYRDFAAASDSLVIALTDVPESPAGMVYEGWLVEESGDKISVGILGVTADGTVDQTYVSPTGDNLIASYPTFAISVEPVDDPDPATPGDIYWADTILGAAFSHIGHLVVSLGSNPGAVSIVSGLQGELAAALAHANLALKSNTVGDKQRHARYVINALQGEGGDNFDSTTLNPGDGHGALSYAADAKAHAGFAASQASSDATVVARAADVVTAMDGVIAQIQEAEAIALRTTAATSNSVRVSADLGNLVAWLEAAIDGRDADRDGVITLAESGARDVYIASQDIGTQQPEAAGKIGTGSPGDELVPVVAMIVVAAGIMFTSGGGLLLFRRRRTA